MLAAQVGTTGASSGGASADGAQQQGQQQQGEQEGAAAGGFTIMGPSRWWTSARQGPQGHELVRRVMRQLLTALAAVHGSNVTHRCAAQGVELSPQPSCARCPGQAACLPRGCRLPALPAALPQNPTSRNSRLRSHPPTALPCPGYGSWARDCCDRPTYSHPE